MVHAKAGPYITDDKHAGCNTYLDSMQSGVTNPGHPWDVDKSYAGDRTQAAGRSGRC